MRVDSGRYLIRSDRPGRADSNTPHGEKIADLGVRSLRLHYADNRGQRSSTTATAGSGTRGIASIHSREFAPAMPKRPFAGGRQSQASRPTGPSSQYAVVRRNQTRWWCVTTRTGCLNYVATVKPSDRPLGARIRGQLSIIDINAGNSRLAVDWSAGIHSLGSNTSVRSAPARIAGKRRCRRGD